MNGYQYLIERNRLLFQLEEELAKLAKLADADREAETLRLQAEFDRKLADLYAGVADEFPGERRKKARPMSDPR